MTDRSDPEFVLELTENPHPRMLAGALVARASSDVSFWQGYMTAMADATGETPEAIEAWMDRHQ